MSADADIPPADRLVPPTRIMRPIYVDRLPPCNHACPAGESIQNWLAEAQAGRYRAAWDILVRDNPMPAVHGRVRYHPCEDVCNRRALDEAVSVHAVERFPGDLALAEGWQFEPVRAAPGRRVLIIGAGPSGLSAAYHLVRLGHADAEHVVVLMGPGADTARETVEHLNARGGRPGVAQVRLNEIRYRMSSYTDPDAAQRLLEQAQEDVARRWEVHRALGDRYPASAVRGRGAPGSHVEPPARPASAGAHP